MKQKFKYLACIALVALCACKKNDPAPTPDPTPEPEPEPVVEALKVTPKTMSVEGCGDKTIFSVVSNTEWTVSATEAWIAPVISEGESSKNVSFLVAPNEGSAEDQAMIIVKSKKSELADTVKITRKVSPVTVGTKVGDYYYVDLGIPGISIKWATFNVGANALYETGDYFAWGETTPRTYFAWGAYKYGVAYDQLTKYVDQSGYGKDGFTDNKTVLEASDDAATANWGADWRMPTYEELNALVDAFADEICEFEYLVLKGQKGVKITGPNSNSIFLPYAGYYYENNLVRKNDILQMMSSTLGSQPFYACGFGGSGTTYDEMYFGASKDKSRNEGRTVRAVYIK